MTKTRTTTHTKTKSNSSAQIGADMDRRINNKPLVRTIIPVPRNLEMPFSRPEEKIPPGRRKLFAAGKESNKPVKPAKATARKLIAMVTFASCIQSPNENTSKSGGNALWPTTTIF